MTDSLDLQTAVADLANGVVVLGVRCVTRTAFEEQKSWSLAVPGQAGVLVLIAAPVFGLASKTRSSRSAPRDRRER